MEVTDVYAKKYIRKIKYTCEKYNGQLELNKILISIVNKIYEEGFEDGAKEITNEYKNKKPC